MPKLFILKILVVIFFSFQNEYDILKLIKSNSKQRKLSSYEINNPINYSKLTEVDSSIYKTFSDNEVFINRACKGCSVKIFYHSYFRLENDCTVVVFAKQNELMSGETDLLIGSIFNKDEQPILSFIMAEKTNLAECFYSTSTEFKDGTLIKSESENCFIGFGPNEGSRSVEKTSYVYQVSTNGKLKLVDKKKEKFIQE